MDRLAYLVRRLLLVIPTFIGITVVCFALTRFLPGGPVEIRLMRMKGMSAQGGAGEGAGASVSHVTEEYRQQLERQFGFDRPICEQYWNWLVVNRMGMDLPSYDYPIHGTNISVIQFFYDISHATTSFWRDTQYQFLLQIAS